MMTFFGSGYRVYSPVGDGSRDLSVFSSRPGGAFALFSAGPEKFIAPISPDKLWEEIESEVRSIAQRWGDETARIEKILAEVRAAAGEYGLPVVGRVVYE